MNIAKPMKEVSVEEILQNFNLIVPEIQREYVWGANENGIFDTFIKDVNDGFEKASELSPDAINLQQTLLNPALDEATKKSLISLLDKIPKSSHSVNIGFLYSHKPGYYIGNDREEDLYLIDGQQRFTTLFLMLFYFSIKENRKAEFLSLFKFDAKKEKIAFDYRVRSLTHQFIIDLIENVNLIDELLKIREGRWFLSNYKNDVTVSSIVGTDKRKGVFEILEKRFQGEALGYFNFVKKDIKFWHFKTEDTSQGEELYITMNSRGQQLADNENIRAKLFDSGEVRKNPLEWSGKWEIWQDFFWKTRNKKNPKFTADEGFNEFLRWVQLLKMYEVEASSKSFIEVLQWDSQSKLNVEYLSLEDIEITFNALKYLLVDFRKAIEDKISPLYSREFEKVDLIDLNWVRPENGILDQINLFKLLPILLFCKKHIRENSKIDELNLFRLCRILFSLSQDETIGKAIRNQIGNVLKCSDSLGLNEDVTGLLYKPEISKTILNNELKIKLELISSSAERMQMENLFWFAEELEYNEGAIAHIIRVATTDLEGVQNFDIKKFCNLIDSLKEILDNEVKIWGNLLHTDTYQDNGDRVVYLWNWYKLSGFLKLVSDRSNSSKSLDEFLISQQKQFIKKYKIVEDLENEPLSKNQLFIYYIICTNKILKNQALWDWKYGYNFGKYLSYAHFKSIFKNSNIYQLYNEAFRENEQKILSIQNANHRGVLKTLFEWAYN